MKYIIIFVMIIHSHYIHSIEDKNIKNCEQIKLEHTKNCLFDIPKLNHKEIKIINNNFDDISYFIGTVEVECYRGEIIINKKICRKLEDNCYQEKTDDKLISNFASFDKEKNIICY